MFIAWLRDQIIRLGLTQQAVGVRALDTQVETYMRAYEDPNAFRQVKDEFSREAMALVDAGAEVIVPAGGLPMLLFARERSFESSRKPSATAFSNCS